MGRKKSAEPYVQQKITLPATLMARFSMLNWDPIHSKTQYGAISEVVTRLLTDYVNKMEHGVNPLAAQPHEPPVESL